MWFLETMLFGLLFFACAGLVFLLIMFIAEHWEFFLPLLLIFLMGWMIHTIIDEAKQPVHPPAQPQRR